MGLVLFVKDWRVLGIEPLNSIGVLHAEERPGRLLEARVHRFDESSNFTVCENGVDHIANELLDVVQQIVEVYVVQLAFEMGEFRQVTTR